MTVELVKMTALEQRVTQLDLKLARAQGALLAAQDVIAALMATHPDQNAFRAALTKQRNFPNPVLLEGYREWWEALLPTRAKAATKN